MQLRRPPEHPVNPEKASRSRPDERQRDRELTALMGKVAPSQNDDLAAPLPVVAATRNAA